MNARILPILIALSTSAVAAEMPSAERLKEKTAETFEATKEVTQRVAEAAAETTRDAWNKTKAYLSEEPGPYREGAKKRLDDLGGQISTLKTQSTGLKEHSYFLTRIDALEEHHKYAVSQLAELPENATGKKDSKRARLDRIIERLEAHLDLAKKEARDFTVVE